MSYVTDKRDTACKSRSSHWLEVRQAGELPRSAAWMLAKSAPKKLYAVRACRSQLRHLFFRTRPPPNWRLRSNESLNTQTTGISTSESNRRSGQLPKRRDNECRLESELLIPLRASPRQAAPELGTKPRPRDEQCCAQPRNRTN